MKALHDRAGTAAAALMPDQHPDDESLLADWRARALEVEAQVARAVVGQPATLRMITVALFARGHVRLEGDVGVGKTTVLRAFARAVGGAIERVEGTVDLMPGDMIYHTYVDAEGKPRIEPGPLLRHGEALATFFFNEINRARPQVQALLVRAMAERIGVGLQPGVPLPAHDGVRRSQPGRTRGDLRAALRRRAIASCSSCA